LHERVSGVVGHRVTKVGGVIIRVLFRNLPSR
jgi:hypothetical protein